MVLASRKKYWIGRDRVWSYVCNVRHDLRTDGLPKKKKHYDALTYLKPCASQIVADPIDKRFGIKNQNNSNVL